MYFTTKLYTYFFGKFVGKDEFNNSYYRSLIRKNGQEKRWVLYKGIIEASKVPPGWHRWLHYTTDQLPNENKNDYASWQKPHQPNFTGTSKAYHPHGKDKTASKSKLHYKPWQPNNLDNL